MSSTSEFIETFAPDAYALLKRTGWWDYLRPAELQGQCYAEKLSVPLHSWALPYKDSLAAAGLQIAAGSTGDILLLIRWPWLFPVAVLGILIGAYGYAQLLKRSKACNSRSLQLWAMSCLWFSMMNLTAIPTHNLLIPAADPTVNPLYTVWMALDVGCTAAACMEAIRAVFAAGKLSTNKKSTSNTFPGQLFLPGMGCLAAALIGVLYQVPWTCEVLYGGTLILSILIVQSYLRQLPSNRSIQSKVGIAIAYTGVAVGLIGPPIDPWLCQVFGPQMTMAHVLFGGCCVIYAGLIIHLNSIDA